MNIEDIVRRIVTKMKAFNEITSHSVQTRPFYLSNTADAVISGYKILTRSNDSALTTVTTTVKQSESDKLIYAFLLADAVGTTTIDAGTWTFDMCAGINSCVGVTRFKFVVFKRDTGGTETTLFSVTSNPLKNITANGLKMLKTRYTQPPFTVTSTDRIGVKVYVLTNNQTSLTVSIGVGGVLTTSYISTPLPLKYSDITPGAPTLNPEDYILDGTYNFVPKASMTYVGGGGMYLTNVDSTIVVGYDQLSYTNIASVTEHGIVVNNNEVLGDTHLFESTINTVQIDAGTWSFSIFCRVSAAIATTRIKGEVFVRTSIGTITPLFSVYSQDLNNTTSEHIKLESYQPQFTVNATDRLGFRLYATTTHNSNVTVYYTEGGADSSYISTPLNLRHSQLRDLNGDTAYQHITAADRTLLNNYPAEVVDWGTTYTATIVPNKYNLWGTLTSANTLAITLGSTTSGIMNNFMFEFKTGASVPTFSTISGVTWVGSTPTLAINKTYQFSIVNGIGVWAYA